MPCRICPEYTPVTEDLKHLLMECQKTKEPRERIFQELLNVIASFPPENSILLYPVDTDIATQFILDCTWLNLPNGYRLPPTHKGVVDIFRISRQYCFAVNVERPRLLNMLKQ